MLLTMNRVLVDNFVISHFGVANLQKVLWLDT